MAILPTDMAHVQLLSSQILMRLIVRLSYKYKVPHNTVERCALNYEILVYLQKESYIPCIAGVKG